MKALWILIFLIPTFCQAADMSSQDTTPVFITPDESDPPMRENPYNNPARVPSDDSDDDEDDEENMS